MNFEIRNLKFNHVITYHNRQLKKEWENGVLYLENMSLIKDIYQTGPIFFSVDSIENEEDIGDFTYYMPINDAVIIEDNPHYAYMSKLQIENALALRQADQEANFEKAYHKLVDYADKKKIALSEKFYCVLLDAYGECIIDLYVPLKK